jgi:hypothetical protein
LDYSRTMNLNNLVKLLVELADENKMT